MAACAFANLRFGLLLEDCRQGLLLSYSLLAFCSPYGRVLQCASNSTGREGDCCFWMTE